MKFFLFSMLLSLFTISCKEHVDLVEWSSNLDNDFLSSCINGIDGNISYCNCVLDKLKIENNFNLTIKRINDFLNDSILFEETINECSP